MLTCRQASQLVSESLDRPLTLSERLRVRLHLFVCTACERFVRQLKLLSNAWRSARGGESPAPVAKLDDSARDRIRERLKSLP